MTEKKSFLNSVKELFVMFFTFCKIGSITFGGGLAMLPILEKELVDRKKWTTNEELLDYYAISQATPGIIAVNVSTFIGHKRMGVLGGIFATLGIVTPSLIIITLIAEFISNFEQIVWVQKALKGINVAVCALLTYSVFGLTKKTIKKWYSLLIYIAAFSSIYFLHVYSALVIIIAVVAGIIIGACNGTLSKKKDDNIKNMEEKK